jgi:hypothetical protein
MHCLGRISWSRHAALREACIKNRSEALRTHASKSAIVKEVCVLTEEFVRVVQDNNLVKKSI